MFDALGRPENHAETIKSYNFNMVRDINEFSPYYGVWYCLE